MKIRTIFAVVFTVLPSTVCALNLEQTQKLNGLVVISKFSGICGYELDEKKVKEYLQINGLDPVSTMPYFADSNLSEPGSATTKPPVPPSVAQCFMARVSASLSGLTK